MEAINRGGEQSKPLLCGGVVPSFCGLRGLKPGLSFCTSWVFGARSDHIWTRGRSCEGAKGRSMGGSD